MDGQWTSDWNGFFIITLEKSVSILSVQITKQGEKGVRIACIHSEIRVPSLHIQDIEKLHVYE